MKPGTYTQCYIQLVFAVKNREALLDKEIRQRVFEYISGTIRNMGHKSIHVNGVADHIHILIGLNTAISISDTVHDIKRNSSLFINKEGMCKGKFAWQEGYGCFSYSRSQIGNVYKYIDNQENHHNRSSFRTEYIKSLKNREIEFDERFLFNFFD